jgi:hypothetical protein
MKKFALILSVIFFCGGKTHAEPTFDLPKWHEAREHRLETGMAVLLGWGATSVVGGVTGRLLTDDPRAQGFWDMTAGWGLVNATLAVVSLMTFGEDDKTRSSLGASLEASHDMSTVFWFNAGFDVGYMALGAWLWERGQHRSDPRTEGFGQAIVIQGAGLLVFDVLMGLLEDGARADLYPVIGETVGVGGRF